MSTTYTLTERMPAPPEGADVFYAGRWIFPDDIVWDRQSVAGKHDSPERQSFIEWLEGSPRGAAALTSARWCALRFQHSGHMCKSSKRQFLLYEDEYGMIVGWPNGGYVHVIGWRKEDM